MIYDVYQDPPKGIHVAAIKEPRATNVRTRFRPTPLLPIRPWSHDERPPSDARRTSQVSEHLTKRPPDTSKSSTKLSSLHLSPASSDPPGLVRGVGAPLGGQDLGPHTGDGRVARPRGGAGANTQR